MRKYILEVGVIGDIAASLDRIAELARREKTVSTCVLREHIDDELYRFRDDSGFPLKPQRILNDVRG